MAIAPSTACATAPRRRRPWRCRRPRRAACRLPAVPKADIGQQEDRQQRGGREPGDAALAARHHDEGGQQRTDRRAGAAAHLKQRLGEPVPPAGRHARNARRLRMEHRRAETHQRRGAAGSSRSCWRPTAAAARSGCTPCAIGSENGCGRRSVTMPDHRLQHRGGQLEGQRDQADLAEVEMIVSFSIGYSAGTSDWFMSLSRWQTESDTRIANGRGFSCNR